MFEMNEEQTKYFEALTPLQKEVSLNSISGMNDIDAYKASRGRAKNENTMRATVSEILTNPNVKAFIKSMASHVVNPAVMSRQEMIERLSNYARTNMTDLIEWRTELSTGDEGEEVEQSLWAIKESAYLDPSKAASIAELTAGKDGFKIKQHSPLVAMKQLAELAGYEAPKQVEVLAKEELTPWGKITAASDE
jgi:phage terminase small subunit